VPKIPPVSLGLRNFLHTPNWRNQLRWRTMVWKGMANLGLTGLHALPVSRLWVELHRRRMPMKGLDPAFDRFQIVQVSDLHYSPMVWAKYLEQFVIWINEIHPDLIVVTGDLITGGYRFSRKVADVLGGLKAKHGVICTLGNHDYSVFGKSMPLEGIRRANHLEDALQDAGLIVLRNEVLRIHHNGSKKPLTIVGLDDEWSGAIDPEAAWANVNGDEAILCLNHNPANAEELLPYPWQWMLSGHTHGRQLAHGKLGQKFYGHLKRKYTHGYYAVADRHLYVNRGLSYGQRMKHWCRPEISIFRLKPEDQS